MTLHFYGYDHGEEDILEREDREKLHAKGVFGAVLLLVGAIGLLIWSIWSFCGTAHAATPTPWTVDNVYRAILTEAVGEGEKGMECVAMVLANRRASTYDHSIGCCGLNRSGIEKWIGEQPLRLRVYARDLAARVMHGGLEGRLEGATRFESTDFKRPSWVTDGSYKEVYRYKKHIFYRRAQR